MIGSTKSIEIRDIKIKKDKGCERLWTLGKF